MTQGDGTPRFGAADDQTADEQTLRRWVSECTGSTPGAFEPIAPGLGHRAFYRVSLPNAPPGEPRSLVLRVDPPEARVAVGGVAPEPELEPIRALLEAAGVPVPRSFGRDARRGLDLLEDVGDDTLERATLEVDAAARRALYREACELVARLQRVEPPAEASARPAAFERRLDRALIATKARKVIEWLLPEALGRPASPGERAVIERGFDAIADLVEAAPARLAHRDYKAANIHLRPGASRAASTQASARGERLVLIDLQGAFLAPPEYDLVCLLRDSHVRLEDDEVDTLLEGALVRLPEPPDTETARLRFDALTLSRVGKDLAHYLDAARSRDDDRYLGFVATGLARLRTAALGLRARDASWLDLADLLASLPLPARSERAATEATSCAR